MHAAAGIHSRRRGLWADNLIAATELGARLSAPSAVPVIVDYASENDVATESGTAWGCLGSGLGCDYQQVRGTVTFIPGEVQKTIAVPIYGDNQSEADKTLSLVLSNPVNSAIGFAILLVGIPACRYWQRKNRPASA